MNYIGIVILSCSIFIPAVIAVIRFSEIDPLCRPIIYCIWIGALNEIFSMATSWWFATTAINNNIYVLLEAFLFLWQFWNWNAFNHQKKYFFPILFLLPLIWLTENFFVFPIYETQPWFRLCYSFLIVLAAINVLNQLIITEKKPLLRHPLFLFCTGIIIFFSYKLIVEACWLAALYATPGFMLNIYTILMWINCIVNIIYAIALLWMPEKLPFSLPY